jgi:hypothetical protein
MRSFVAALSLVCFTIPAIAQDGIASVYTTREGTQTASGEAVERWCADGSPQVLAPRLSRSCDEQTQRTVGHCDDNR